ncbi:protein-l-isoaspartate(d-aspartate) o-methyltransferase-like [Nannochloropsis oceanica]
MAWFCSGRSNTELVQRLRSANVITSERVKEVMLRVDRANYAPNSAYEDSPQYLGYEQTISAPHMHAHALELLKDKLVPGATAMDVGCGSGYLTVAMGRMVEPKGRVVGIDIVKPLVALARKNIAKADGDLLEKGVVTLECQTGWEGDKDKGPYDAIHVGAAAASIPRSLVEQLKVGGIMILPVGPEGGNQALIRVEKIKDHGPIEETYVAQELLGVRYVPLVRQSPYT